jgi:hypothetical protein
VISKESLEMLLKPYFELNHPILGKIMNGYGIMIESLNQMTLYRHCGWLKGVRTELSYNPKNQVTAVILSNFSPSEGLPLEKRQKQDRAIWNFARYLQEALNSD